MRSPCKKGRIFYCVFHHYFLCIHPYLNIRRVAIVILCISVIAISSQLLFARRAQADASISLDPDSGPTGTEISISGSGFEASKLTYVWFDSVVNGTKDTEEEYQMVVTTSGGELPPNLTLTAPEVEPADYQILVDVNRDGSVEAWATFTHTGIAASLALDPDTGPSGMEITITGTDFDPDASGWVWFDSVGNGTRDTGEPQVSVNSTAEGTLPGGVTLTVPDLSLGNYYVRADIPEGDAVEASALFDLTQTTIWLTVTKKDAYGNVLDTITVDYEYMMNHMPIQGDGGTHYYHQGPTFDDSSFDALWNPGETVNIESRDYGTAMGTDVKDLCNLVSGGASPGDVIEIRAVDNFNKKFDYEDVYDPEPEQGKMVITWYTNETGEGEAGFVPYYSTGMRLIFFAQTMNPDDKYVFGDWDMHETLSPSRWHYYFGSSSGDGGTDAYWPSSSGLSVKYVSDIIIHEPNLISCDEAGNPKDDFTAGEEVWVKGLGLDAETIYNLWIQDEPVLTSPLNELDRPTGDDYILNPSNDPSGTQESVETGLNGDFGPLFIWDIDPSAGSGEYDIIADNQASGTPVTYEAEDAIDGPGRKGFGISELTEIISFTVTDYNNNGIQFGTITPGIPDQPADGQPEYSTANITVGAETNVTVDIQIKGIDFTRTGGGGTIFLDEVKYDSDSDPDGANTLTDTYYTWYTVDDTDVDHLTPVYFWISVPAGQPAGDYESMFYYKAVKH